MRVPHRKLLVSFLFSSMLAALSFKAGAQERGINVRSAPQGRYFALVIGNDDYRSLPHLKTAAGDAREVEETLRRDDRAQTLSFTLARGRKSVCDAACEERYAC